MTRFSAVQPGTDLARHARELARVHDAVFSRSSSPARPRAVVARSWSRMLTMRPTPEGQHSRALTTPADLEWRRRSSPLQHVVAELGQVVDAIADSCHMLLVIADADGVVLWRSGSTAVRCRADRIGFCEGAEWTESQVGTNAIGTALVEAAPVQLFSAEHFEHSQHSWYCTGAPIHDPRTGRLIGVVNVSGPAMTLHPTVNALVETAVRMAEAQLWQYHERQLDQLRSSAAALLAARSGPAVLVDEDGWVAQTKGVVVGARLAVPHTGRPMQVPGLGLCTVEPIVGGCLVVPSGTSTRTVLTLSLCAGPTVEVVGPGSALHIPVSVRHAEILLLLHAHGSEGLSAAQTSKALFGDTEHIVSARAEISRLRRVFGGIISSRPYRIADGVELRLDAAGADRAAESPFVTGVACAGVRQAVSRS